MLPRNGLARLLVLGAVAGLGWFGAGAFAVRHLVARPGAPRAEVRPNWLEARELRLTTADGEELGAWFHPARHGRACVVLLHGMGGSRASLAVHAKRLADRGNGFLSVTQRAFGDSTGERLDFGWSSRADLHAALDFLAQESGAEPIVVIGQSLGAATAIYSAAGLGRRVAGYVLEAPYHDLVKACHDRLSEFLWPPAAAVALTGMRLGAPLFLPVGVETLRPIDHMGAFPEGLPVLFIAGGSDSLAPASDVRHLSERCKGQVEYLLLEGRTHKDLWKLDERHWSAWDSFLTRVETSASAQASH